MSDCGATCSSAAANARSVSASIDSATSSSTPADTLLSSATAAAFDDVDEFDDASETSLVVADDATPVRRSAMNSGSLNSSGRRRGSAS